MRKILFILCAFLCLATHNSSAQDKTSGQESSILLSQESQKTFLLVPMMEKMFLSNVTHEIGKYNGMSLLEIRKFFREFSVEMTSLSSLENWNITNLLETNDSLVHQIQVAQSFDYDPVVVHSKQDESRIKEIWHHLHKNEKASQKDRGVYLERGEIKEFYDSQPRFMNAVVDTAWVFNQVLSESDFDYVMFINELDINKPRPTDPNYGENTRTLKLHFTLYSKNGKRIFGNAAFSTFDENMLDIYEIANSPLYSAINRMIAECSNEIQLLSLKK